MLHNCLKEKKKAGGKESRGVGWEERSQEEEEGKERRMKIFSTKLKSLC